MPKVIPPGYASHIVRFSVVGSTEPKSITIDTEWDTVAFPTLNDLQQELEQALTVNIIPSLSDQYTITEIATEGNDAGTPMTNIRTVNVDGADAGDVESPQVTVKVLKRSGLIGRRFRGMNSWPGLAEAANVTANGVLTTSAHNTFQAVFDAFLGDLTSGGAPMVILHGDELVPLPAPTTVTSLHVMNRTGTQRRRVG